MARTPKTVSPASSLPSDFFEPRVAEPKGILGGPRATSPKFLTGERAEAWRAVARAYARLPSPTKKSILSR